MRFFTAITILILLLVSCAPVKYYTYYEGGKDPFFDLKSVKTIGFTPGAWTKKAKELGVDELAEKQLYIYAKEELEKRGYTVFYIFPEDLENPSEYEINVKPDYKNMPDLTLMVSYFQNLGNVVNVPGQSYGTISWGKKSGSGSYGSTEGYKVQTYMLGLDFQLWSGAPKYINKVWEGTIKKGSPKPDLADKARQMTFDIFLKKFPYRYIPPLH